MHARGKRTHAWGKHACLHHIERACTGLVARLVEGVEYVHMLLYDWLQHRILPAAPWLPHHFGVRLVPNYLDEKVVALRLCTCRCVNAVRLKLRGIVRLHSHRKLCKLV